MIGVKKLLIIVEYRSELTETWRPPSSLKMYVPNIPRPDISVQFGRIKWLLNFIQYLQLFFFSSYAALLYLRIIRSFANPPQLKKNNHKSSQQITNMFSSAEIPQGNFSHSGVYRIPCLSGSVYLGSIKGIMKTRISEHKRCCHRSRKICCI